MEQTIGRRLPVIAWSLTAAVLVAAFIAWAQGFAWQFRGLSSYALFPIFGLTAFSIMWVQYVIVAIKTRLDVHTEALRRYFEITSFAVLLAIMLHPGLLIWQLWRDGFGLPPQSYLQHYVAPGMRGAALIGTTALFIFLAFELRYMFNKRPWWRYVSYLQDAAIIGIFIHALKLGTQTQHGWFQMLWWTYGLILVLAIGSIYLLRYQRAHKAIVSK